MDEFIEAASKIPILCELVDILEGKKPPFEDMELPPETHDTLVLVAGEKCSGKSSLIDMLASLGDTAKDSLRKRRNEAKCVQDFSFLQMEAVSRTRVDGLVADSCSVYELTSVREMIEVSENLLNHAQLFKSYTQIIVLDLGNLESAFNSAVFYLEYFNRQRRRWKKKSCPKELAWLESSWPQIFPKEVIVGLHYDKFQNYESIIRKNFCKFLRWIGVLYGVDSICMGSTKELTLRTDLLKLLSTIGFPEQERSSQNYKQISHSQPVFLKCQVDDFMDIGLPWQNENEAGNEKFVAFMKETNLYQIRGWSRFLKYELRAFEDLKRIEKLEAKSISLEEMKQQKVPFPECNFQADPVIDAEILRQLKDLYKNLE